MISSVKKIKLDYNFSTQKEVPEKNSSNSRLYLDFYSLKKPPFTITPDPEFLYSSSTHKSALENILYGIQACMGFILLIGEVGTGKTTLCRAVLDSLGESAETVYIINPSLSGNEIIEAILDDLGIDYPAGSSKKVLLDRLNRFLLETAEEKPVVIIIDDAQTMTPEGLENLRLLSNLETDKKKLLQIILAGQQELQTLLARPALRQLKQRISVCCRLDLIGCTELKQYISLRLFVAGDNGNINFTESAVKEIYRASRGIPRLINIICDYTMTAGYVSNSCTIKKEHAVRAVNELRRQSLVEKASVPNIIYIAAGKVLRYGMVTLMALLLVSAFIYRENIFNKNSRSVIAQPEIEMPENIGVPDSNPVNTPVNDSIVYVEKEPEDSSVKIEASAAFEDDISSTEKIPANYIVQISSLKTREAAIREVMSLRKKGFDANWSAVHLIKKGTWHRVYQGGFSTKEAAVAFKKEKGLTKGIVIHAPWSLLVTSKNMTENPEDIYSVLQGKGLECSLENNGDKDSRLITGAFRSFERAQKAVSEIVEMGFNAKPVLRQAIFSGVSTGILNEPS